MISETDVKNESGKGTKYQNVARSAYGHALANPLTKTLLLVPEAAFLHGNKAQSGGTQLFQLEAPNVAKESPSGCSSGSLASPSAQRAGGGGGGICSALLEVIEKLRDEEESTDESSAESESGRKRRKLAKQQREESEEHRECRIETSVVSSLLDDDYCLSQGDVLLPPGEPAPAKPRIAGRKARSKKQPLQASEAGALAARNTG